MKYLESLALGFIFAMFGTMGLLLAICIVGVLSVMKPIGWLFLGLFILAGLLIGTVVYLIDKHKK